MWYDSTFVLTFGNVTNSGTSKIKARKDGKEVEFAKRTRIMCDKNHITGVTTKGQTVVTVHGFIENDPKSIDKYKKDHKDEWLDTLGGGDFVIQEDKSDWEESKSAIPMVGEEELEDFIND